MTEQLLEPGTRVRVYYNSRLKTWSAKDRSFKKVIAHPEQVYLKDAKFIVHDKGRRRVLRERKKNVHAFVEGIVVDPAEWQAEQNTHVLIGVAEYNPYLHTSFVVLANPIKEADRVSMSIAKEFQPYTRTKPVVKAYRRPNATTN